MRITHLKNLIAKRERKIEKIMALRLITGIACFILVLVSASAPQAQHWVWLFLIVMALFIFLVIMFRKHRTYLERLKSWHAFLERQHERKIGGYRNPAPYKPASDDGEGAVLDRDLQLFGEHSIFSLIDECLSSQAKDKLATRLLHGLASTEEIRKSHEKIQRWLRAPWALEKYVALFSQEPVNDKQVVTTLQRPFVPGAFPKLLVGHFALWPIAIVVAVMFEPRFFILYSLYSLWSLGALELSFNRAQSLSLELRKISPRFNYLEKLSVRSEFTSDLSHFKSGASRKLLGKLDFALSFMSVQAHPIIAIIVNGLMPWSFVFTALAERSRKQLGVSLPADLKELHDFEIGLSLALFHKDVAPTLPLITSDPIVACEELGHPLIPESHRVTNSFAFSQEQRLVLITGSNMSGKSTFLRTFGVNLLLARMGAPVFARTMKTFIGELVTCLRVVDSIDEGYSSFYYEVLRIKEIFKRAQGAGRLIYLVDEIFRGTNNRERLIGAQSIIEKLIPEQNCFGFITTHDLSLTEFKSSHPAIALVHFRDDWKDGSLQFSYKLHPGPCPTTNALKIMLAAGLPVKI